jgi:nucleotide-binding universal stress UspA family protein
MALRDILLHMDNSRSCSARLEAAIQVAQTNGAHLAGLYVIQLPVFPYYAEVNIPREILEAHAKVAKARADAAQKTFIDTTNRAGLSAEWRCVEGEVASHLTVHARYVDLVLLGQVERDDPESTAPGLIDRVVLGAGRPVLTIPYIGMSRPLGQRVIVGWDASREAVRAINDALPLLERAQHVTVLSINPPSGEQGDGDIPSADICLHLARHGVKAEAHQLQAEDIEAGAMLLSYATDQGADLIVSGAYGHSRLRELVLGGVTRHLVEHMTVPVFMSH